MPEAGHTQEVEITNVSLNPVDISGWRFWVDRNHRDIPQGTVLMPDESFVVHVKGVGQSDGKNLYTGTAFPPLNEHTGSVALFVPGSNFTQPEDMIDYMQWGPGPDLPGAGLAKSAGIWPDETEFVTPVLVSGVSMQWCSSFLSGAAAWDQKEETVGVFNPCALVLTPTEDISWGKVKSLFRD